MSKFRQKDLRRVWHSEVRFGWAVPLRNILGGSKGKTRRRILQHIFECEDFVITKDNTCFYVEQRAAPRQYYRTATVKELEEELGLGQPPSNNSPN